VPDIVDAKTRSRMMSGIRSKNTRPEIALRKALHKRGFRYRLHSATVSGRPDIVFPAHKAAVFVHGCFWHGHDCRLFRLPQTRPDFWDEKIKGNQHRDKIVRSQLGADGWRQLVVWECAVRSQGKDANERVADKVAKWLRSTEQSLEIRGD
jgi:DNA mismatch endonuclease, patch repair protein